MPVVSALLGRIDATPLVWFVLLLLAMFAFGSTAVAQNQGAPAVEGDPAGAATLDLDTVRVDTAAQADAPSFGAVLPDIRLTPRRVDVPGLDTPRVSLDGVWAFRHDLPETFDGTADSVDQWDSVQAPGHFALQGFDRMHKDMGLPVGYHRSFEVPEDWRGRRVVLRFEGVDGLTRVWINGQAVGQNDIATLPSEFDITHAVHFDKANELALSVERSLVTHWSRRELGGITRTAYVMALPSVNLARLHVDTRVTGLNGHAELSAHVRVANQSDSVAAGYTLSFELDDQQGNAVRLAPEYQRVALPPIAPGQTLSLTVPMRVSGVQNWTAESPHLYDLRGTLKASASADASDPTAEDTAPETVMSAAQRFGFRDVRVVGHELRVNGQPITMRGTNYHITYPGLGETVPRDLIRRDLELFLDANFNAMRSRPTPDIAYVELCDEMGLYTTIEAMLSIMIYDKGPLGDHGADPAIAPGVRNHVATMIESYYSNPSVLTWGLGNECPYYDYFQVAALGAKAADPSRPLFFASDGRQGVGIPFIDINDDHYPRQPVSRGRHYAVGDIEDAHALDGTAWDYPTDRPIIFTEWLHVHTNNVKEIDYDPGVDEFWGFAANTHMEQLYARPSYAGGFHFKGAPYRGVGVDFPWRGVFDEERRPLDLVWHVKKTHSPVRIDPLPMLAWPRADDLQYRVQNRHDFRNLSALTFAWRSGDQQGTAVVQAAPGEQGVLAIPRDGLDPAGVDLDVIDPDGRKIDVYRLQTTHTTRPAPSNTQAEPASDAWTVAESEQAFAVEVEGARYELDRATGLLTAATADGQPVLAGPPKLLVLPAQFSSFRRQQDRTLVNQAGAWRPRSVEVVADEDAVRSTAHGAYDHAEGVFQTTVFADGWVEVAWAFTWTGAQTFNVFSSGLTLPVHEGFDTLTWDRRALWSTYPPLHIGRAQGRAPAQGVDLPEGEPLPWSQKLISGVTRDFRSTKFNVYEAGLRHAQGPTIRVDGGGRTHVQAVPAGDDLDGKLFPKATPSAPNAAYQLHVLNFHNGGNEPHLTKSLRYDTQLAEPGAVFSGKARFRVAPSAPEP
ncbi:MAG: glycoside hydrolase family 2 TIM barrel-domain containing protein [Planctomycetota bacterium]